MNINTKGGTFIAAKGFLGGLFDNDELLWFIIIFLLLFYRGGYGYRYGEGTEV